MGNNSTIKDKKLSKKQKAIAESPYNTRMLLIAGPGTGKTHTLLHRLKNLVLEQNLEPFSEVLVLSFSRAAIHEIKSRVSTIVGTDNSTRFSNLNIYTFDSFATRLLIAADPDRELHELDYDARIQLAIQEIIKRDSEAVKLLAGIKHILVDEIQDLTGVRAQLTLSILTNVNCGFTLAGDPAQGIFDFQVKNKDNNLTSVEFLNQVKEIFDDNLEQKELNENFRTGHELMDVISSIRPYALPDLEKGRENYRNIRRFLINLQESGTVINPDFLKYDNKNRSIAILCRLNAEVMAVADSIRKNGVPAVTPPSSEEKGLTAWIGRVFSESTSQRIIYKDFEKLWEEIIGSIFEPDSKDAWRILKLIEGKQQNYLDINTLKFNLRNQTNLSGESEAQKTEGNIIVTTIHQAKGREYDHVIILPPEIRSNKNNRILGEESRVLYVAMTRARRVLTKLGRTGLPIFSYCRSSSGQLRYLTTNREGNHFFEVGIPGDIDQESFASNCLFQTGENIYKIQNIIWSVLKPGAELLLKFEEARNKYIMGVKNPRTGNLIPLATMSNDFYNDIEKYKSRIAGDRRYTLPTAYDGISVVERKTIMLPPYPENVLEPYASSGFCLGVTVRGLIKID